MKAGIWHLPLLFSRLLVNLLIFLAELYAQNANTVDNTQLIAVNECFFILFINVSIFSLLLMPGEDSTPLLRSSA